MLFPGGPAACAVLPTDTGFHSELYMLQTDVLSMTNLTGGAATAAASSGSPGSPHSDLYSDLQRGSGGENRRFGTPPSDAQGRASAQPFPCPHIPSRCDSACPTGAGAGSFTCAPLYPPPIARMMFAYCIYSCRQALRLIAACSCLVAALPGGAASRPSTTSQSFQAWTLAGTRPSSSVKQVGTRAAISTTMLASAAS